MDPVKTTYLEVTDYDFRRQMGTPVTDEQDAVQKALAARGVAFRTYDIESVVVGGKELKGQPENFSSTSWVGIDRVYTRDEVIASMRDDMKSNRSMAGAIQSVIGIYEAMDANSVHITGLERQGEFIEVKAGQKVFDRKGAQIWPKEEPKIAVDHAVKPMKQIQLKPR